MPGGKVISPSATRTVTVRVTVSGKRIEIDDADQVVRIRLNDKIRWVSSTEKKFWIVFEDRSPFTRHVLRSDEAADFRKPLLHGAFKYHIVLDADRLVRLDPVVVVDPPPDDETMKRPG
jgi:hypothetical protein